MVQGAGKIIPQRGRWLSPDVSSLVRKIHEPLGLGCGEVEVVGQAIVTCDADREPASAGAESGLALG
jgi:hypothetical protein